MKSVFPLIGLASAACLFAQSQSETRPLPMPGAKPGQQPTVTMSVENPPQAMPAVPPDTVVLTVGDEKITAAQWETLINALPEQFRNAARGAGRRQFAENIVRIKVLAQEARKRKLDQAPAYRAQLAFQSDNLLAGAFFQSLVASAKVEEADARRYYEEHKSEYERVRARHILIRMKGSPLPTKPEQKDLSEEEALGKAQDLHKKLAAGADFAALAQAESDDAGTASNGGDLGLFRRGQMVPAFDQVAFSLAPGQLSNPLKTEYGFHLIRVEQKETKTFDEIRPDLETKLRPQAAQKLLEELRKQQPVDVNTAFFGPAPEPPAQQSPRPPAR
jgi:peptidyl-prolyl cis-trans isomerase C